MADIPAMNLQLDGDGIYRRLGEAKTLSGNDIFRNATDRENHFRRHLQALSFLLWSSLQHHGISGAILSDAVAKLRIALNDPRHYGDNTPGTYFENRTPVVPDPRFSFWDLLGFGASAEGGFAEFKSVAGIESSKIDYAAMCGIIGLLLVDSSVDYLNWDDVLLAASEGMQAANCVEEMLLDQSYTENVIEARRKLASAGGRRPRPTDRIKRAVIREWDSGRYTKPIQLYEWARRIYPEWNPQEGKQTIRRWIRESRTIENDTQLS